MQALSKPRPSFRRVSLFSRRSIYLASSDHGQSGRLATQARTPVLTRRALAAGPVPLCVFFFLLDFGVATLDFVAPCRFAAPDGVPVRALLSLDLVRGKRATSVMAAAAGGAAPPCSEYRGGVR